MPIIPNTNGTETLKEVLFIFAVIYYFIFHFENLLRHREVGDVPFSTHIALWPYERPLACGTSPMQVTFDIRQGCILFFV